MDAIDVNAFGAQLQAQQQQQQPGGGGNYQMSPLQDMFMYLHKPFWLGPLDPEYYFSRG